MAEGTAWWYTTDSNTGTSTGNTGAKGIAPALSLGPARQINRPAGPDFNAASLCRVGIEIRRLTHDGSEEQGVELRNVGVGNDAQGVAVVYQQEVGQVLQGAGGNALHVGGGDGGIRQLAADTGGESAASSMRRRPAATQDSPLKKSCSSRLSSARWPSASSAQPQSSLHWARRRRR